MWRKLLVLFIVLSLLLVIFTLDLDEYASLASIQTHLDSARGFFNVSPLLFSLAFLAAYIFVTALSIPIATVLTLTAGAICGLVTGTILVSFASSLGATISLMLARYVLRDGARKKFAATMDKIDRGMDHEGGFYLFALRLVPVFPFFLVNILMGLTSMSPLTFYWISQLGMLPATILYVNAGLQLSTITAVDQILSARILLSLAALGLMPVAFRHIVKRIRSRRVFAPYLKQKPKSFDFDLVVVGAGAAGLVSAYIGAAVKAKVALVEKHKMGGDCLNTGCVPSKALIHAARLIHEAKNSARFGIKSMSIEYDFADVMERVAKVIRTIEPHDSIERYQNLGVDCIHGAATITSPWTVTVDGRSLTTRNIIIACGAKPNVLPIPGIAQIDYLTSDNLWTLKELPKRLVILGGGPIGCELAQAFARLGAEVSLVEKEPRIMPNEDVEVSEFVRHKLEDERVLVLTGHSAHSFHTRAGVSLLTVNVDQHIKELAFDRIIIAVGRKARTKDYGLDELGIELRPNGTIEVNEYMATKYPNIFACGDVVGPYQFTHVASHQAWYCAVNALSPKQFAVDYRAIPWCTYTDPEIATVGMTEHMAQRAGIAYDVTRYGLDDLDRAIIDGADEGFVKVLTSKGRDEIIGATIVAKDASNLITEFVTAIKHRLGLNKILSTIHVYPSLAEANKYVAGNFRRAHTSPRLLQFLANYFAWRRK